MNERVPDRRCGSCGALVSPDATWCGQCFAPLAASAREPMPSRSDAPGDPTGGVSSPRGPMWPCPVCGGENAIDLDACAVCGTPFSTLMHREDRPARASPRDAVAWSLVYPGLGLRKLGLPLDALARAILFTMCFGMTLLLALGHVRGGPAFAVLLLFLFVALSVYVGSAFEAHRVARGGSVLIAARALMWLTVAVVMASVVSLTIAFSAATRR